MRSNGEELLAGRSQWIALLCEVLPRALLAEFGLARILLGSSGGGQFLLVLPGEARGPAEDFLNAAARQLGELSGGYVSLLWSVTENLGDWTVVRKRLNDEFQRKQGTPLAATGLGQSPVGPAQAPAGSGQSFTGPGQSAAGPEQSPADHGQSSSAAPAQPDPAYFENLGATLRDAVSVAWSPESPAVIVPSAEGKHSWTIGTSPDSVPLARHTALTDNGREAATAPVLASRAEGLPVWGVLRGDVDGFGIRVRRLQSIEEYVSLSVLYKQFFAGEVEVLCSLPEFWRRVNLLYTGGDDFAVVGAWDALIGFARELQRLFQRFTEEHLKEFPGPEGKTISMALALAPELDTPLGSVYARARDRLEIAKSADKDCFYLLGRTLEWKQLSDAAELKDELTAMVREFGVAPQYIRDLCGIYRETRRAPGAKRVERPWRFHRRLLRILGGSAAGGSNGGAARGGGSRTRDFQKARTGLIADLVGKNPANIKLRPSGRVALEWARLSTEGPADE